MKKVFIFASMFFSSIYAADMSSVYMPRGFGEIPAAWEFSNKIYQATLRNDVSVLQRIVTQPFLSSIANDKGMTPLHIAAFCGHAAAINFFIALQANFDIKNFSGMTPLHMACFYFKAQDGGPRCGLFCVTEKKLLTILMLILEAQSELANSRDAEGNTPLHIVAKYGTQQMADLLVMYGASLTIHNHKGMTPENVHRCSHFKPFINFKIKRAEVVDDIDFLVKRVRGSLSFVSQKN